MPDCCMPRSGSQARSHHANAVLTIPLRISSDHVASFLDSLRTGSWLNRERLRLWPLASLVVTAVGVAFLISTAHGLNDYDGRPLGTDFSAFYSAGTYAREERPQVSYEFPALYAREQAIFGDGAKP